MIDKSKKYLLIYAAISFKNNLIFLNKIKKEFGFEIPFLDISCISDDLRSVLDSYLYLEQSLVNKALLAALYTKYKQISFTDLGYVDGVEIYNLINNCIDNVVNSIKIGDYYKIIHSDLKNLIVKVVGIKKDSIVGEFFVMNEARRVEVPISDVCLFNNYINVGLESQFINYVEESKKMNKRKAIIVDGHNILYKSMFGYSNHYTAKNHIFVGGAFGTYFALLKLKELFPEYEIHFVFDGYDADKFDKNPHYKAHRQKKTPQFNEAFKNNLQWVKEFVYTLGFNLYHLKDSEGDDVIGSIAKFLETRLHYEHILIYSADGDFYTLVDDVINLYIPRVEFRDTPARKITVKEALEEYGVDKIHKINWVKSICGDGSDNIGTVNIFNKDNGIKCSRVKKQHYLSIINECCIFDSVKIRLLEDKKFKKFIESGKMDANFKLLTIKTDLFNNKVDLSEFAGICNQEKAECLLEKFAFFKELEMFEKNFRILRGVW